LRESLQRSRKSEPGQGKNRRVVGSKEGRGSEGRLKVGKRDKLLDWTRGVHNRGEGDWPQKRGEEERNLCNVRKWGVDRKKKKRNNKTKRKKGKVLCPLGGFHTRKMPKRDWKKLDSPTLTERGERRCEEIEGCLILPPLGKEFGQWKEEKTTR